MWGYGHNPGAMGYDGGWSWWMALHGVFWLVFLVVAVVAAVALIRWLWHGAGHASGGPAVSSARRILEERYARGEIDREEYLQKRNDLE